MVSRQTVRRKLSSTIQLAPVETGWKGVLHVVRIFAPPKCHSLPIQDNSQILIPLRHRRHLMLCVFHFEY